MKKMNDTGLLIIRIMTGGLMLFHGISKIFHGVSGIVSMVTEHGLPGFLAYAVYLGEVIGPLAVVLGYRTRIGAALIAINMVVAVWMAHPDDFFTLARGGSWALELHAFYFFTSLVLVLMGGGKFALSKNKFGD